MQRLWANEESSEQPFLADRPPTVGWSRRSGGGEGRESTGHNFHGAWRAKGGGEGAEKRRRCSANQDTTEQPMGRAVELFSCALSWDCRKSSSCERTCRFQRRETRVHCSLFWCWIFSDFVLCQSTKFLRTWYWCLNEWWKFSTGKCTRHD